MKHKIILLCIISGIASVFVNIPFLSFAQQIPADTLRLSVPKAEQIFLQKNLTLLANQYNIDINKALVQQSKVWDNPILNTDQNIYDGKFFRHTTENGQQYGQIYIQVQQLIRTAGKIKKQTQLAADNVLSTEAQFNDVMRNLKYLLTTDLNTLAQLQNIASIYTNEMQTMNSLVKGMDAMLKLGDISEKENIRIKALLFSMQSDFNDNQLQQIDLQKEIAQMLQLNDNVWVQADADQPINRNLVNNIQFYSLRDSAMQNRPDLAFAKNQSLYQLHNIAYQKALAKPDFSIGLEYDHLNSYVPNYYGLAISVPLTIFNKNKGNIEAAKLGYQQSNLVVQQVQSQVNNEILGAWMKLKNVTEMLNSDNNQLQQNYDVLMKNMTESYRKREVRLTDFIDFFDAYKDTRIKQWQLTTNQRNAAAELNFTIHQNIFQL